MLFAQRIRELDEHALYHYGISVIEKDKRHDKNSGETKTRNVPVLFYFKKKKCIRNFRDTA